MKKCIVLFYCFLWNTVNRNSQLLTFMEQLNYIHYLVDPEMLAIFAPIIWHMFVSLTSIIPFVQTRASLAELCRVICWVRKYVTLSHSIATVTHKNYSNRMCDDVCTEVSTKSVSWTSYTSLGRPTLPVLYTLHFVSEFRWWKSRSINWTNNTTRQSGELSESVHALILNKRPSTGLR